MRFLIIICSAVLVSTSALADLATVREDHIVPRYAAFAEAAAELKNVAHNDCSAEAVLPAYHEAYDAWIAISHIQFGPIETRGTSLSLTFWPDPKDRTGKALNRLFSNEDGAVFVSEEFAQVSVAAQGFSALERLLTEPQGNTHYACAFIGAIATHIAGVAQDLAGDWQGSYGDQFAQPDASSEVAFSSEEDAERAVYTSISTALEFMHDQRLGRPLGTFDRPRPLRAEARRTERSSRHVLLGLQATKDLTNAFVDESLPDVNRAFDAAIARAETLDDPAFSGVADPARRFKIEVLQRSLRDVQVLVAENVGAALGINAGFNSLDGD